MADRAPRQADLALGIIAEKGRASPEEIVETLSGRGQKVLLNSIRARCTELHKKGKLRPSGSFGKGESGKVRVIRWEIAPPTIQPPQATPEA